MFWTSLRRWSKLRAAAYKKKLLLPHLSGQSMLDVGTGNGGLEKVLIDEGLSIQGIDIQSKSIFNGIDPLVYDGHTFPFEDNAFDTCLIITVLHHTPNPERILEEAKRCAKRVIIVEDIYNNVLQKHLTYFTDSLVNLEFRGHPHTNKTDREWKALFERLNMKLTYTKQYRFMLLFRQVIYVLGK